jgi:hypothetical protein
MSEYGLYQIDVLLCLRQSARSYGEQFWRFIRLSATPGRRDGEGESDRTLLWGRENRGEVE